MITIEIILLVIAYTLLIVTIFLQIVCYQRNLETLETIALTISLLLLVISLTASSFLPVEDISHTNVYTLLAMVLVGLMVPLNLYSERQHRLKFIWKKILIVFSAILFITVIIGYFFHALDYLEYVVVIFLGVSITLSMIMIRVTKPMARIAHREKTDRIFAVAFMVLIPLSLLANYAAELKELRLNIGFTIPLVFILLTGSKFLDDLQRLSLFKMGHEVNEQQLKNYNLTDRECEIAHLLVKGKTYQQIGEELFISMPTVKTHASNIYRKCKVKTRSELTALINR